MVSSRKKPTLLIYPQNWKNKENLIAKLDCLLLIRACTGVCSENYRARVTRVRL